MSKVIGIDLGSTFSSVAIVENGKAVTIPNEEGERTTPSVIGLKNGERKIGSLAKRQQVVNPKETVILIKRFMGSSYADSTEAIQHVQYEVANKDGFPRVRIEGNEYTPEELSSMILGKLKKTAEDYLGETVKDAVITVPAYFNDSQRQATKTAGELAGLNVLRVIAEPTAALLASNIDLKKGGKFMVVDFGGATLDNSIADISDSVVEILATNGNVFCGGSDIDKAIALHLVDQFKKEHNVDLSADSQAYARLYEAAEKAKIELSNSPSTDISLPYITAIDGTPVHFNTSLTRAKLEQLMQPTIAEIVRCGKEALKQAKVEAKDLNGILLVGGSCRIPLVQSTLEKEFGVELIKSANLDECVAMGAAVQGSILNGETSSDILLLDVTPLAYGIETLGGVFTELVPANTTIPCKKEETFSTAQDNQPMVQIRVLQGGRAMAKDNKEVGVFTLDGIMPAKKGVPQIQVQFDIDANGILSVKATDLGTKKEQHITIQTKGVLSDEEINKIKEDAAAHAEEDKKLKEQAEALNQAEQVVYTNERLLEEHKDKLSDEDKTSLTVSLEDLKTAIKDKNYGELGLVEKELNDKWNAISQKLYSQTTPEQPKEETTSNGENNNVEDVEFEEVN